MICATVAKTVRAHLQKRCGKWGLRLKGGFGVRIRTSSVTVVYRSRTRLRASSANVSSASSSLPRASLRACAVFAPPRFALSFYEPQKLYAYSRAVEQLQHAAAVGPSRVPAYRSDAHQSSGLLWPRVATAHACPRSMRRTDNGKSAIHRRPSGAEVKPNTSWFGSAPLDPVKGITSPNINAGCELSGSIRQHTPPQPAREMACAPGGPSLESLTGSGSWCLHAMATPRNATHSIRRTDIRAPCVLSAGGTARAPTWR